MKDLLRAMNTQREKRVLPIHFVFDQRDGLKKRIASERLQARLAELRCDPLDGGFIAAFERHPPFERIRGEERQVRFERRRLNRVEAGVEACAVLGR